MTEWNRLRIEDSHFFVDEFRCGGRYRNREFFPDGCPDCHGSVVLLPWVFRPLELVRRKRPELRIFIKSGTRCLAYNRNIYALRMYDKLYDDCTVHEQLEVQKLHDSSRHMIDGFDAEPDTDDPEIKEAVYREFEAAYSDTGYGYTYRGVGFIHCDTRWLTKKRLGI